MKKVLPYLAAVLIITATGIVQGLQTDRWSISRELSEAAARIDQVPMSFGDWAGQDLELDPRQLEVGGITRGLLRRYKNRQDGRSVDIFLVCGRPGPISVHTPDICYAGSGYASREAPTRLPLTYGLPLHTAEAWRGDFVKQTSVISSGLRIVWSWCHDRQWAAPDNPRLTFARFRSLYKLYVIRGMNAPMSPPTDSDLSNQFLAELLPELDRVLAPGSPG